MSVCAYGKNVHSFEMSPRDSKWTWCITHPIFKNQAIQKHLIPKQNISSHFPDHRQKLFYFPRQRWTCLTDKGRLLERMLFLVSPLFPLCLLTVKEGIIIDLHPTSTEGRKAVLHWGRNVAYSEGICNMFSCNNRNALEIVCGQDLHSPKDWGLTWQENLQRQQNNSDRDVWATESISS